MRNAERIVISCIVLVLIGGSVWGYLAVTGERADLRERVAAGEFEIRDESSTFELSSTTDLASIPESEWRRYYPVTYAMTVGDVLVDASVADTHSTRIQGLSDTPYLPANVVKLFAYGKAGPHSIWMKNMNYPIDILWADEAGQIVHIEERVSPDTYDRDVEQNSRSFASPVPAWFVVETNAGFVEQYEITVGDSIVLPSSN